MVFSAMIGTIWNMLIWNLKVMVKITLTINSLIMWNYTLKKFIMHIIHAGPAMAGQHNVHPPKYWIYTLWLFNIAMENGPFIDDFPIKNLHL